MLTRILVLLVSPAAGPFSFFILSIQKYRTRAANLTVVAALVQKTSEEITYMHRARE